MVPSRRAGLFIFCRFLEPVVWLPTLRNTFFLAVQVLDKGEGFRENLIALGLAAAVVTAVISSSAKVGVADAFNHVGFNIQSAHDLLISPTF